jgi:hypothetical protein
VSTVTVPLQLLVFVCGKVGKELTYIATQGAILAMSNFSVKRLISALAPKCIWNRNQNQNGNWDANQICKWNPSTQGTECHPFTAMGVKPAPVHNHAAPGAKTVPGAKLAPGNTEGSPTMGLADPYSTHAHSGTQAQAPDRHLNHRGTL